MVNADAPKAKKELEWYIGANYGYVANVQPLVLKWGTASLQYDTQHGLDPEKIKEAAKVIRWLKKKKKHAVGVVSGAVEEGIKLSHLNARPEDVLMRQYLAAKGQVPMIVKFNNALRPYGITILQSLLTREELPSVDENLLSAEQRMERNNLLNLIQMSYEDPNGFFLFNTDDTRTNEELLNEFVKVRLQETDYRLYSTDNDVLSVLIGKVLIGAKAVVMVSYPRGSNGSGSGGGTSKLNATAYAVESGIYVAIVQPSQLVDLLGGKDVGTKFLPDSWGGETGVAKVGLEACVTQQFLENAKAKGCVDKKATTLEVRSYNIRPRNGNQRALDVTAEYNISELPDSLFYKLSLQKIETRISR